MNKNIRKTQTRDIGGNLAWQIKYSARIGTEWVGPCLHDNFAEGIGQALYAFHEWIQHNMGTAPSDYKIEKVYRILRNNVGGDLRYAG
jgi:hypothetical protein